MAKERIGWVDVAKAFAIIAIILGHILAWFQGYGEDAWVPLAHNVVQIFYSYHVALFFILSGYTSKAGWIKLKGLKKLCFDCFVPYFVSCIFFVIVGMILTPEITISEWLAAIVYGAGMYPSDAIFGEPFGVATIGALWFLPALFVGKIVSSGVSLLHPILRIIVAGFLFLFGSGTAGSVFLPFGIQAGLCASWWITCGMLMKEHKAFESLGWEQVLLTICGTIGVIYVFATFFELIPAPSYVASSYHNGIIDMLGTTALSMLIMGIAQLVSGIGGPINSLLELLGKSTLPVFCGHAISLSGEAVTSNIFKSFCGVLFPSWSVMIFACVLFLAISFVFAVMVRFIPVLNKVYYHELKKPEELGV